MMWCIFRVFLSIVIVVLPCSFAQLQLTPNPLPLTNGDSSGSVNISCGIPSGVTASSVNAIIISRYLKSAPTTEQILARAEDGVNLGLASLVANSGLTQNTATVSGSTSQKSMTLTLTQAKCEDAGTYVCKISYNASTGGNSLTQNIREDLTVTVLLGDISISISPNYPSYNVGNTVTISCDASIGSSNSGQEWIWEYHDGTGWHPYPEENNIIKADPVSGAGSCQYYRQTCHLNRVISMEDNGRYYRCTVKRGGETAKSETIRIEKVEDHTTSGTVTTTKTKNQVSSACGLANVLISFITSVSLAVMMPREI
ncbi:uncharacterized protein LOC112568688 [Pomacea canaliculata]|uniref:uncharacterized protein LOC112568688 n=1 Tax=Pomacea canaliculata TaxID=400727 RepID=UPI000D7385F6|nr:uncharacterized protein LOC112568688 [Pomacea canaliculata]XP_025101905.1 uncharacterized protein LOC112568688 [Pomacea canaliculata]XP_025101906.1 uncharacterized protein LOC112568688 [Pomacea canaliculata]XP_025101907.1 uncharacterized protein LOC112568688 [Pomacea canaliculata]